MKELTIGIVADEIWRRLEVRTSGVGTYGLYLRVIASSKSHTTDSCFVWLRDVYGNDEVEAVMDALGFKDLATKGIKP